MSLSIYNDSLKYGEYVDLQVVASYDSGEEEDITDDLTITNSSAETGNIIWSSNSTIISIE